MNRTIVGSLICAALFVVATALFLIAGAKRRRLDALLKSAAFLGASQTSAPQQLRFFTPWQPSSTAALAPPERRWAYDQDYMIAFVAALEQGRGDLGITGLRFYAGPILSIDIWFAVFFATFIACTGLLAADHLGEWPWLARTALLGACLGVVYGVADVAEDAKLRRILIHAEQVTGARGLQDASESKSEDEAASQLETVDAAEVDAANALTRIKMVMLSASVIGGLAFVLLFIADLLVGAASGGPSSGASTPTPQPVASQTRSPGRGQMKAHIVGGGFGGLAAAAYLIRNAGVSGQDITVYEADERMGGGFFLGGSAQSGYNLPGSVFDNEFRCTFDLLDAVPSASNPAISVKQEFFTFNTSHPFDDRARLINRHGQIVHGPRFGLSWSDVFHLARLSLTPEAKLDGRRIEEFFSAHFFGSEFWLCYSTIMGSLPQHSAMELRRYLNRTLHMFPYISDMANIWRTPFDQYDTFIEPLVAWLRARGVNLMNGAFVQDIGFEPFHPRITVNRLDYERDGATTSIPVAPDDLVLLTFGSQAADMSVGSMTEAPRPLSAGRSWALWKRLAQGRPEFGNPDAFFGPAHVSDSRWVTFTVTTTGTEFLDLMSALTGSETGSGGLVSLIDSGWLLSLSVFHQPEIIGQPPGTYVWWGYGVFPERNGNFVQKRMDSCTGAEILEEVLRQLRFDQQLDTIMASSICIPCDMPYANNIWLKRTRTDRPPPVPEGSTNLGLVGQYVEVSRDVAFTIEYSARTAWEAIHLLLKRGPAPPPVYQAQYDLKALFAALKVFVFPTTARP